MSTVKLPSVDPPQGANLTEKVDYLTDIVQQLKKNLEYYLNNVDAENIVNYEDFVVTNLTATGSVLITKGDEARVFFDGNTIAMQIWENGAWVNKVYFDSVLGKYVFDGELSATYITVLSSLITQVLFAETGYIAELTVDRLLTHDKVQRYLNNDQSDVKWIWIQDQYVRMVSSEDCLGTTEYVYNRQNEQMFWVDETHTHVTTENTGLPVLQFLYAKELVKMSLGFESDGVDQVPMLILGAGTGITGDKDGRGFIYKDDGGLYIEYHTYGALNTPNDGAVYRLGLSEAGIDLSQFTAITYSPTTLITGLVQIWVQDDTPVSAKTKDVWIDTNEFSRYDLIDLSSGYTLEESDSEQVRVNITVNSTLTLHTHAASGIIKKIYNVGTAILTVAPATGGYMNGVLNGTQLLYTKESAEFITNGTGWDVQ